MALAMIEGAERDAQAGTDRRAFGAEVEIVSSPEGITPDLVPRMIERSKEIVQEVDGFATDQFRNRDMLDGYAVSGGSCSSSSMAESMRSVPTSARLAASWV